MNRNPPPRRLDGRRAPGAAWKEPSSSEPFSRSIREHVRELEATSREFETARTASAESFRRSIETGETRTTNSLRCAVGKFGTRFALQDVRS